jgi:hypothetical protein
MNKLLYLLYNKFFLNYNQKLKYYMVLHGNRLKILIWRLGWCIYIYMLYIVIYNHFNINKL